MSPYLSEDTQNQVRQRANYLCEYCHTSEQWQYVKFTIDHVIPLNQGGLSSWAWARKILTSDFSFIRLLSLGDRSLYWLNHQFSSSIIHILF